MFRDMGVFTAALLLAAPLAVRAAETVYDELPSGAAAEVARLYHRALAIPGLAAWSAAERLALLEAVTLRHRDRLVDRGPGVAAEAVLEHLGRLATSGPGRERPELVARGCARHGLTIGPCSNHVGHVRRALILEEMLAQSQLTLEALEMELTGAARPGFDQVR